MKRSSALTVVLIASAIFWASTAFAVDLERCEWRPASNRSVVSIEQAAARFPAEDRGELVQRFNARDFDDQVTITRDAIVGGSEYRPQIRTMNFGAGRVCRSVTRRSWTASQRESAIVFHLASGRSYGWAAVCGNAFALDRVRRKLTPAAPPPGPPLLTEAPPAEGEPPMTLVPPVSAVAPPAGSGTFAEGCDCGLATAVWGGGAFYGGGSSGGGGGWYGPGKPPEGPPAVSPPIPEPETMALMGAGLAVLAALRRRSSTARVGTTGEAA